MINRLVLAVSLIATAICAVPVVSHRVTWWGSYGLLAGLLGIVLNGAHVVHDRRRRRQRGV